MSSSHVLAVILAAVGATLFGLSAVHQHGAVLETMSGLGRNVRHVAAALLNLVRQPAWLIGTVQSLVAGVIHVIALALAPVTLVQPIGVLAVPATVVASAIKERRRPSRPQVAGSLLSVAGIVCLTVLLLAPERESVLVPGWGTIAVLTGGLIGATGLLAFTGGGAGPRSVRCVALASAGAVLFGLNSILIRLVGHLVRVGEVSLQRPVLTVAVIGVVVALPVGLWAMHAAYLSGTPHVVVCCLTLVDPLAAVLGGRILLHEGAGLAGPALAAAIGAAALAAAGVLLLSLNYVDEVDPLDAELTSTREH